MFLGSAIILLFIIYFYNYVVINAIIVNNAVTVTYLYCYHYCRYYAQFIPFYYMIFSTVSQIGPIHKGSGNQGLSIWEGGTHPFPGVESVWSIFLQSLENKAEKTTRPELVLCPNVYSDNPHLIWRCQPFESKCCSWNVHALGIPWISEVTSARNFPFWKSSNAKSHLQVSLQVKILFPYVKASSIPFSSLWRSSMNIKMAKWFTFRGAHVPHVQDLNIPQKPWLSIGSIHL